MNTDRTEQMHKLIEVFSRFIHLLSFAFEPPHDKTNKMISVPREDSDQTGHPPSLISVFAVHSMGS